MVRPLRILGLVTANELKYKPGKFLRLLFLHVVFHPSSIYYIMNINNLQTSTLSYVYVKLGSVIFRLSLVALVLPRLG